MRSYRDLCGIARALDVVGERWALLVVRELLLGPKRFADLHRGLPGLSQNVLTQRLRELEASGVLERRRTLPPAGTGLVYDLTDRGRDLQPVLLALGRWGSPMPPRPGSARELSADALVVALRTTFEPVYAADVQGRVQIYLPDDAFLLTVAGGRLEVVRGERAADATLTCAVLTVQGLVFNGRSLKDAVRSGDAHVEGDAVLVEHLLATFDDRRTDWHDAR